MSKMRRNGEQTGCSWGAGGVGRLGRFSVGRLLLDSPLLGRRFVHRAEQNELRQTRSVVVEPQVHSKSFSSNKIAVEVHTIEDDDKTLECPLCLSTLDATALPRLMMCAHRCCESCLKQYLTIEICEARVPVDCPACHEPLHPQDVKRIVDNLVLYDKYEEFCVRRALSADPDARWCPAPDCNYAVIATGCASCPKLTCLSPGCGATFCYHCKATWHPTQTCDAARRERRTPTPCSDFDHGELKSCPRCSVLIVKVEDGSCNHMVCCVCGAEFCWLCMKEVSDLHYLSPSGCTFWGKKPWSRKKKLLWQLGTLAGAPLGIALVAGVTLPALLLGLPVWAGRRAHRRLLRSSPGKRRAAVAAAVTAALIVSPVVAGLTVGIGVPILLFYVYGVVPVSLCRAGGCGGGNTEQAPKPQFEDAAGSLDAVSRRLEPSIGDASLSAGSHQTEVRAPSLAALAGSIAGNDTNDPNRIEVSADIATSDTASAISWPEDFPRMSSDAQSQLASVSRSTLLKNLFLHGTTSTDPETGFGPSTAAAPSSPAPLSRSNDRIVHINETRSLKDIS